MKTKYRIKQVGNEFYPQKRVWYWPFWLNFSGQFYGSITYGDSKEEVIAFLKQHISKEKVTIIPFEP